eukprot:5329564-Pyramimonas_sp.AAC.1
MRQPRSNEWKGAQSWWGYAKRREFVRSLSLAHPLSLSLSQHPRYMYMRIHSICFDAAAARDSACMYTQMLRARLKGYAFANTSNHELFWDAMRPSESLRACTTVPDPCAATSWRCHTRPNKNAWTGK